MNAWEKAWKFEDDTTRRAKKEKDRVFVYNVIKYSEDVRAPGYIKVLERYLFRLSDENLAHETVEDFWEELKNMFPEKIPDDCDPYTKILRYGNTRYGVRMSVETLWE